MSRHIGRLAVSTVVAAVAVAAVLVLRGTGSGTGLRVAPASAAGHLPAPPRAALEVPARAPVRLSSTTAAWAPVQTAVMARVRPDGTAPAAEWVSTLTPEGTSNIVVVVRTATGTDGRVWQEVRLPALPREITAWVPRSALGALSFVDTELIVDRKRFMATLVRAGRAVLRVPVGVGTPSAPTPPGTYYVRDVLTEYASPEYGPVAFGTSARSPTETEWPAGGYIGIHGTDQPQLIPGAVSHGCIRMRNADIERLSTLMPVGTPVIIR